MASAGVSSRSAQLGGGVRGGGGATSPTYYCFKCDRTFSVIAILDSGLICPNCSDVLEQFETPPSSPSPSPPSYTTSTDLQIFFPTSDIDSDVELSGPLPPPPPPPQPRNNREFRRLRPLPLPLPPRPLHPEYLLESPPLSSSLAAEHLLDPVESDVDIITQHIDLQSFFPTSDIDSDVELPEPLLPPPPPPFLITRSAASNRGTTILPETISNLHTHPPLPSPPRNNSEFRRLRPLPPPPPPPPPPLYPEYLLESPPPSSSLSAEHLLDPVESDVDFITQQMPSIIHLRPPPPPPPLPISDSWDYFFEEPELSRPSHQTASQLRLHPLPSWLQPPPPPSWPPEPPHTELLDMTMTEKLVMKWESHQCAICLDKFELNQMVKLMPCIHLFHSACLSRWFDSHKSCPVCRYELPSW